MGEKRKKRKRCIVEKLKRAIGGKFFSGNKKIFDPRNSREQIDRMEQK